MDISSGSSSSGKSSSSEEEEKPKKKKKEKASDVKHGKPKMSTPATPATTSTDANIMISKDKLDQMLEMLK